MNRKPLKICCLLVAGSNAATGCTAVNQGLDPGDETGGVLTSSVGGAVGTGGSAVTTGGVWLVGMTPYPTGGLAVGVSPYPTGGTVIIGGAIGTTGGWYLGTGGVIADDSSIPFEDSGVLDGDAGLENGDGGVLDGDSGVGQD